ncbi:nucleotidyl transferase AbiEii/AbiGii toxin family protein [Candidatus Peregrinibacteria bacterium]|nr:nucleotidyl transferase AbiEii/AbiGii toxin family protein [Candidatus Peregrinibacteria bacterium]
MSEQIVTILKRKLDDFSAYGGIDAETMRNAMKEELQFYVLNFIYHHPQYNKWIMYGGSALRIIHKLHRMSVDLDFEVSHSVTDKFLKKLKKEIENYFMNTYGASADFLTIKITPGRGLLVKFHVGKELSLGHSSNQVHVKIDLNHFFAPKTVIERWPINHGQLSFVIVTYNMSSLMASKLAAIFLRGARGVGNVVYEEKGRDIYDLLWYMGKKIVPDFDYLIAKGIDIKDPRILFDKLTLQMNKVSDSNLKNDLSPLFADSTFITNWLKNWRESYFRLLDGYNICTVTNLLAIGLTIDSRTDVFSFIYIYATLEGPEIKIEYRLSDYWIHNREGDLPIVIDEHIIKLMTPEAQKNMRPKVMKQKQYATLFYQKTENYFKKINHVMFGDSIVTKIILMTTNNFNPKEQIVLNKSTLLSCELDDLLK